MPRVRRSPANDCPIFVDGAPSCHGCISWRRPVSRSRPGSSLVVHLGAPVPFGSCGRAEEAHDVELRAVRAAPVVPARQHTIARVVEGARKECYLAERLLASKPRQRDHLRLPVEFKRQLRGQHRGASAQHGSEHRIFCARAEAVPSHEGPSSSRIRHGQGQGLTVRTY